MDEAVSRCRTRDSLRAYPEAMPYLRIPTVVPAMLLAVELSAAETAAGPRGDTARKAPASASGEYLFQQWTSDDGLPQNSVLDIAQTTDGHLWLSTFGGVARFDGVEFESFDSVGNPELARFHLSLSADPDNGLWLSQAEDVVVHHSRGGFRRLTAQDGLPEGRGSRVAVGPDGTIWAGLPDGRLFRREAGRFVEFAGPPRAGWGRLWQLSFDSEGRIWTEQGGEYAFLEKGRWVPVAGTGNGLTASAMTPVDGGGLLIQSASAPDWLLRYQSGRLVPEVRLPVPSPQSLSLFRQRDGTIWALNLGPLWRRAAGEEWKQVGEATALAGNSHRRLFEDREGNLWIGTDGGGLFRLRRRAVRAVGTEEGLTRPVVLSVAVGADGEVLTAVHGRGVQRFDGTRFRQDSRPPAFDANQLAWSVWPRADGGIWVGTYGLGLFHLPASGAPETFLAQETPGLIGGPISVLSGDSKAGLWIGGDEGLSLRSPDGGFRRWGRTEGLLDVEVGAVVGDGSGGAWVGTEKGLNHVTGTGVRTYRRGDGLAHDIVRSLFLETNGTLWIGGGGLTRLKEGKFRAISAKDGLPSPTIKSLLADDLGSLWWGTARGLYRCPLSELEDLCEGRRGSISPTRFHRADGMPSNECSGAQPASWKGPDGRLWFATLNGLAVVDPGRLPRNPMPPPVVIRSVEVDGRSVAVESGRVEIAPGPLVTEFRYTALSFVAPEGNRFRCQLEGLEDADREMGTTRTVAYTRLAPGEYTLKVTAANSDGVWNTTGARLSVVVLPFLWQTLPFRVAAAVLSVGTLAGMVRWLSQRRLLLKVAHLERDHAVNRERARIARNMHDDVGASLTQIGLLSELARRQISDRGATESRLHELGELSREVVRNLDAMVWTVDPEHDSLASLVEYLAGFAQDYVRSAGLTFRLDLPPRLPEAPIPAAARHHVLLLLKEALNNALKHARATEVTLRAEVLDSLMRLEIRDNGQGFDTALAGRFNDGLENMRERARLAGGECVIRSTPGSGTLVSLDLPLSPT
jgi:signal transduction histidine kinase/ligand-binding sensor domain-containing protein